MEGWRRNLYVVWFATFASLTGGSLVQPFLPLFINRDLGVTDPGMAAIWFGLATSGGRPAPSGSPCRRIFLRITGEEGAAPRYNDGSQWLDALYPITKSSNRSARAVWEWCGWPKTPSSAAPLR